MFARLVRFSFGPGKHAQAQSIADNIAPLIASQQGCQGVTVFGDQADGEYGIFVLWDSEENASAAAQVVRPRLDEYFAGNVQATPDARLFKVLS